MQFTTVALLVLHLTGSGLGVSGAVVAEVLPVLLLAPVAGPVVDRLPRPVVMVAADLCRAALAAVLVAWHGDVAVVYAVTFGLAAGSAFFNPASSSLLPSLVPSDELVAANGGIWSVAVLSQVALAPVAGVIAATAGFAAAFAVNAVSFVASAVIVRGLRSAEAPRPVPTGNVWRQGLAGFRLVLRHRLLRALAVAQALAALSAGATSALLVVLAEERLGAGRGGYGLILAAIGVGAFAGPFLLARFRPQAEAPVVFGAFGLRGVVDVVLATVTALPAALGALVVYGLGTSTGNVTFSALLQRRVAAELRGRAFATFDVVWQSMRLVSIVAGGAVADAVGIRAVYYAGGALLLCAALAGARAVGTDTDRA